MLGNKGKINILVVIIIIVVQLLIVGAVWFFLFREPVEEAPAGPKPITKTDVELPPPPPASSSTDKKPTSTPDNTSNAGARDFIKDYAIFSLGDVVLNPSGADKNTYFITTISFEYRLSDKNIATELKNKTPIFRDSILSYFSRFNLDDFRNIEMRDTFKEDIQRMVNSNLLEGRITSVLFEQFVIQ